MEVVDATSWYSVFSIVILPINSVINPILYSKTVLTIMTKVVLFIRHNLAQILPAKVTDVNSNPKINDIMLSPAAANPAPTSAIRETGTSLQDDKSSEEIMRNIDVVLG